jgi:PDZ domain-containing protein
MAAVKRRQLNQRKAKMQEKNTVVNELPGTEQYPEIRFGFTWLIMIPSSIWVLVTYYLPVSGGTLNRMEKLVTIPVIVLLVVASLSCHILSHIWAARLTHVEMPSRLTVLVFGDASQSWRLTDSQWQDVVSTGVGPIANLLIAGLTYLLWRAQINDFWGNIVLLVCGFNFWLFLINLIPAFPMDGGRLMKSLLRSAGVVPAWANRGLRYLGWLIAAALVAWGIFLFSQHSRFSLQTASIEFLFVLLLLDGLRLRPAVGNSKSAHSNRNVGFKFLQVIGIVILVLLFSAAASTLLFLNNGLDAPGVALPIESMVRVPAQYRHDHVGHFYLTTVFSHAPILFGEWMWAQVDPAVVVVPPERVVPKNTTPQKQAAEDYQMLDDSEATAIAVGLRLAGYPSAMTGKGARITSIVPESHANDLLQVGDVIIGLNGAPIQTTADLIEQVKAQSKTASVELTILRNKSKIKITVPLMAPTSPADTPKIGIAITSAGFDFKPPFPISIVTQKISGGPSAGLMFTLTVYNTLSAKDLTGGRKIAGTGTISLDGTVGPIGGVKQKVAAAEAAGAVYFLCPAENYKDALSVARRIKIVEIATAQQAIEFLQGLSVQ